MMETNDILREISDELHNMNLNLVELISVLKEKSEPPKKIGDDLDDTLDTIAEAMKIHREQLTTKESETTLAQINAEDAYLKKQANFDQALRQLGIM